MGPVVLTVTTLFEQLIVMPLSKRGRAACNKCDFQQAKNACSTIISVANDPAATRIDCYNRSVAAVALKTAELAPAVPVIDN